MKLLVIIGLALVALAASHPSDIVDFEADDHEREEEGSPGEDVEGEYSWTAPDGSDFHVKYEADENGYRVVDSNAVPENTLGAADGTQV